MSNKFQRPHRLHWPDMPMPTVRMACVAYVLIIVYASLFPFNFGVAVGADIFDWVLAPIPKYITSFDIFTNILGYVPLGFLLVFAVYPNIKDYKALIFSLIVGLLLSGFMEALQTWLATRIPSNVDWWANIFGVGVGALLAIPLGPRWLSGSVFHRKRYEWFGHRSSGILLLMAFPLAQIYPQSAWLAMGDWGQIFSDSLNWSSAINYFALEMGTTALAWIAVALTFALSMKDGAPRLIVICLALIFSIVLKSLFNGMQFGADKTFAWLTPAAFWGVTLGSVMLAWLLQCSRRWLIYVALIALGAMLVLVNFLPQNPYYLNSLREWKQGRLIHFNYLMSWLSWFWPIGAILSLLKALKRG